MRWWLIRHSDQTYSRPIPELTLIEKIETGELAPRDEICLSGGYWFPIQDVAEVRKFFGENIRLDRNASNGADTSTTLQGDHGKNVKTDPLRVVDRKANVVEERARVSTAAPLSTNGSFEVLDEEPEISIWNQIGLLFVLILIFSGTVYLLWANSRK